MPFVKGNQFGRESSRAISPELKVLLKVSKETLIPSLIKISSLSVPELKLLVRDESAPSIDIYIASCLIKGMTKGDPYFLNIILDRVLGRPKQDLGISLDSVIDVKFSNKTDEELAEEAISMANTLKIVSGK